MIVTVQKSDSSGHGYLLEQMYRLRARTFFDRRRWRVSVHSGKEIDSFDELDPLYVLSVSPQGELMASLRLLQTTGPHMLADVFPETMSGAPIIRHPLIWESSRFCVNTDGAGVTRAGISAATSEILLALFEVAQRNAILNVVTVYDLLVERVVRRAGCPFDRLGEPFEYDGLKTVAAVAAASNATIKGIREKTGIDTDIFTPIAANEAVLLRSQAS